MTIEKTKSTLAILERLIAFKSVSSEDNRDLIDYIAAFCAPHVDDMKRLRQSEQPSKESLLLTVLPKNNQNGKNHCARPLPARENAEFNNKNDKNGGLILSGHIDVVPVVGQNWHSDPFILREEDGKLYGRGTADMKGFVACALALLPEIVSLSAPLYLALTCDEEIGCLAAPKMAAALQAAGAKDAFAWVGEPTNMGAVVGQKGISNWRTHVRGRSAHSSQIGQGISAVHIAAELVCAAEKLMYQLRDAGKIDPNFNVPFSSIHVGKISGGTAINIIAQDCSFDWEIRHLPESDVAAIMQPFNDICAQFCAKYPDLQITTTPITATVAALADENNDDFLQLLTRHLPNNDKHYVAYATEAGIFQQAGWQTLICGPGDIAVAHQANEYVEISQLELCTKVMRAVLKTRCGAIFQDEI